MKISNEDIHMKIIVRFAIALILMTFIQSAIVVNRPYRIDEKGIDEIVIRHEGKEFHIKDRAKISGFTKQIKRTILIPNLAYNSGGDTEQYALAFYKNGKSISVFSYEKKSKEFRPVGYPINNEIYGVLDTFINENCKIY